MFTPMSRLYLHRNSCNAEVLAYCWMHVGANVTKILRGPVRIADLPRQRYIARYHKVNEEQHKDAGNHTG